MRIDRDFFKTQAVKSGMEPDISLPDTIEELLTQQIDPEEFDDQLEWLLTTCKNQLERDLANHNVSTQEADPAYDNVFLGNVSFKGNFYLDQHTYILGDLDVEGVILVPEDTILIVAGSISCEGLMLSQSYLFVLGNVLVRQCALAVCPGFLKLTGQLAASVYIQDEDFVICAIDDAYAEESSPDKVGANHFLTASDFSDNDFINQLSDILGEANVKLDDEGSWEFDDLFERIGDGKKVT